MSVSSCGCRQYEQLAKAAEFLRQFEIIIEAFKRSGTECIVFKGIAAGAFIYGDVAVRPGTDFDILVGENSVQQADLSLRSLGYVPEGVRAPLRPPLVNEYRNAVMYYGFSKVPVHLYWHLNNLVPWHRGAMFDMQAVWGRAKPLRIGAVTVLTLAAEDMLLYLCMHAFSHACAPDRLLQDIVALTLKFPYDPRQLSEKAASYGVSAQVYAVCRVAQARCVDAGHLTQIIRYCKPSSISLGERLLIRTAICGKDADGWQILAYAGMNKNLPARLNFFYRLFFPRVPSALNVSHPLVRIASGTVTALRAAMRAI